MDSSDLITAARDNFMTILSKGNAHGKMPPANRGKYMEMIVYDLVCRVAETVVGEDNVTELMRCHVDMEKGKNAEADILVNEKLAVFIKTSYRERWKQVDRDATIMTMFNGNRNDNDLFRTWSVFWGEHDTDTEAAVVSQAAKTQVKCYAATKIVSIKDTVKMQQFIDAVKWAVTP